MLNSKLEAFVLLLLTLFIASCGGKEYGGDRTLTTPTQSEEVPPPQSFNTRLSNNLLVAGEKCRGGETSENNGQIITCSAGQYLVTVDNINTCDSAGRCTEVGVFPIIGEVINANISDPNFAFFNIIPSSPVSTTQASILNDVSVRVLLDGSSPQVVFK